MATAGVRNFASSSRHHTLSLANIRAVLQRLEDTILFHLIERAQFAHNPAVYRAGAFPELVEKEHWRGSWVEWFLKESESAHAKARRWQAPDEWPFTEQSLLPKPILPALDYPEILYPRAIHTVNQRIFDYYRDHVVPAITRVHTESDDGQYGSSAVMDVEALSSLSRRIHFGMFVSESKFLASPTEFVPAILARDSVTLERLITKPEVEARLLRRLAEKAEVYGRDLDAGTERRKIEVETVVAIYRDFVIPMTKVVEVEYLLKRLDGLSDAEVESLAKGGSRLDPEPASTPFSQPQQQQQREQLQQQQGAGVSKTPAPPARTTGADAELASS